MVIPDVGPGARVNSLMTGEWLPRASDADYTLSRVSGGNRADRPLHRPARDDVPRSHGTAVHHAPASPAGGPGALGRPVLARPHRLRGGGRGGGRVLRPRHAPGRLAHHLAVLGER